MAKVVRYEDLREARAKRTEKEGCQRSQRQGANVGRKPKSAAPEAEKASADNGNRGGRKRRSAAREVDAAEPKAKGVQMKEVQVEEDEIAPEPARASVARMSEMPVRMWDVELRHQGWSLTRSA